MHVAPRAGRFGMDGAARLRRMGGGPAVADNGIMTDPALTVYHDGSCPLCRAEIGQYRRARGAERIAFVDVSQPGVDPGFDLPRDKAMGRFHVRLPTGELRSGAAAFVEIWKVLPRWRPVAGVGKLPGALPAMELGYRAFSPFRPMLAKIVGRFTDV